MILDDLFKQMLASVASEFGCELSTTRAGYALTKGKRTIGFTTFVTRQDKLKVLVHSSLSEKPTSLGNYTKDDLSGKTQVARNVLKIRMGIEGFGK